MPSNPVPTLHFPTLSARDLEGHSVELPEGLAGDDNLVVVAFRREHQAMVDSWVAWFETLATEHPTLRVYEIPVLATRWSPARGFIDGGMAQAVRERDARRRTLTVYTDVRRVTDALAIDDTATVTVLLVASDGRVRWRTTGPWTRAAAEAVLATVERGADEPLPNDRPAIEQFAFAFEPRYRRLLTVLGVTSGTAHVTLTPERLVARFGPWTCATPLANVLDTCLTGPYHAYKAIGPRVSVADRGLTFGTTTAGGVCVRFREPVPGIDPFGAVRHPGLTLTLAEPESFVASLGARAALD